MIEKELEGTPIHYWIAENQTAESILFVHAAFTDHTSFDKQLSFFTEKYQVITLDLIGHGKSVHTAKGDCIEKTANYIYQIMSAEGIGKLHLVGVSIGAILIQDFANRHPDKVASLCCIGAYDINNFDPSMQKENRSEQMKMIFKAIFSIKWFAKSNKLITAATPEAQEEFYQMNIKFKKSSLRYLAGLSKLINQYETKERNYPLLIGCGNKDVPMEIKASNMWHESEPESKLVVFENAGHLVNMDAPEKFNEVVYDHITENKLV
jgi:pimeloyl-ACP methyl ester carboxylesterase